MDNRDIGRYDLSAYCAVLAKEFDWANKLNSMARQASAIEHGRQLPDSLITARKISQEKKDIQNSKSIKHMVLLNTKQRDGSFLSVAGISLSPMVLMQVLSRRWGTRDLHFYQLKQIKRVRIVRRADGYYTQFCIDQERLEKKEPTSKTIGLDLGLTSFYTDSNGQTIENPLTLRKSEKSLKRLSRRMSKTQKGSNNRAKFRNKLARKHLKVSRQPF